MVDIQKEEFLQRLDVRLVAMSGMLAYHEKYIASLLISDRDDCRKAHRIIEEMRNEIYDYIVKTDSEIQNAFDRVKKEIEESEDAKNET